MVILSHSTIGLSHVTLVDILMTELKTVPRTLESTSWSSTKAEDTTTVGLICLSCNSNCQALSDKFQAG